MPSRVPCSDRGDAPDDGVQHDRPCHLGTGREQRAIRARALRGPAWSGRGAVTIGIGGIAFLLNVLLVTAAGAIGAVRLDVRSALLLVLGVHRLLLVVFLLVVTGLGGG
ncbi:unnamed protein product (mitochondrion) [Plasmodiophora brassicae]|uniref:Uncharacterized protein n=1 Tax=Plasmodiophora brassicae TaxID=37360 RepID=A0A3P3YGX6_PLABS|nr:unnamed protein product [Plasmodiophora brassicae]